jgi:hypothetical protein
MSNQIHAPAVLFPGKGFSITTECADPNAMPQTQIIATARSQISIVIPVASCLTV